MKVAAYVSQFPVRQWTMAANTVNNHYIVHKRINNTSKHPYLSFHSLPTDEKKWLCAIHREECGEHFRILRGSTDCMPVASMSKNLTTGSKNVRKTSRFEWTDQTSVVWLNVLSRYRKVISVCTTWKWLFSSHPVVLYMPWLLLTLAS